MIKHYFEAAYIEGNWLQSVSMTITPDGRIARIEKDSAAKEADKHSGYAVPGMANLHSHAFQRAMAGLGEVAGPGEESFWSWRKVMYQFLSKITPEDAQDIASQLYMEMLKAGFTSVGEFHYLHHQPDGTPYSDRLEMSRRMVASAEMTGIDLTLLPVLYSYGGFGAEHPSEAQRRFIQSIDDYLDMIVELKKANFADANVTIGMAPHSLRATDTFQLNALCAASDADMPLHIHIAEQQREVDDCISWCGMRPVEHLFDTVDVDSRWSLIHATHLKPNEISLLTKSGATVGLCPITEANLGDGLFPITAFNEQGGHWGIGSDSNVRISLAEECRTLEYGQRLMLQKRTLIADRDTSNGQKIFDSSLEGGARSLIPGEKSSLVEGAPANFIILDSDCASLTGRPLSSVFDSWIFSGDNSVIKNVFVRGKQVVTNGHHRDEKKIAQRFKTVMKRLVSLL